MSSVKCNGCGMICWAGAEACKGCGTPLVVNTQQNFGYGNTLGAASFAPGGSNAKKRTGMAIASLVLGIISLPTLGLLGVGALAGIVLGLVALGRARRHPSEFGGQGLAIGGIVASVLSLLLIVPIGIVTAIAIPNLLASRRAANEASAINSMRIVAEAEGIYQATRGNGQFGTMANLLEEKLVDDELADGFKNGYHFNLTVTNEAFEVTASPVKYQQDGTRSFYFSSAKEIIHAADKQGIAADAYDPPLPEFGSRRYNSAPADLNVPQEIKDYMR